MKNRGIKAVTERLILLLVSLALVGILTGMARIPAAQAEMAPNFSLKDLQGHTFTLKEKRGKPVLLVFGATWCPSCREEIPNIKEMFNTYEKKGVVIAYIDIQEPRATVERFAEKYKLPYPVLLDENMFVARNYHVRGVPNFILIDKSGAIVCQECTDVIPLLDKLLIK